MPSLVTFDDIPKPEEAPSVEAAAAVSANFGNEKGNDTIDAVNSTKSTAGPTTGDAMAAQNDTSVNLHSDSNCDSAAATAESNTLSPKKRKVTPNEDSGSKQNQQKKINQMSLSAFFPTKGDTPAKSAPKEARATAASTAKATPPASKKRKHELSPSTKSSQNQLSVLEMLTPPSKGPKEAKKTDNMEDSIQPIIEHDTAVESHPCTAMGTVAAENNMAEESQDSTTDTREQSHTTSESETTMPASCKKPSQRKAAAKKAPAKSKQAETPKRLTPEELPEDRLALHQKYTSMKEKYLQTAAQLLAQAKQGIEEEAFERCNLEPLQDGDADNEEEFPTRVVTNILLLVEGSELPLSTLAAHVCSELQKTHGKDWSIESVTDKIKVLAQRKASFVSSSSMSPAKVDLFEDADVDRLWRWEITTLDLLPSETLSKAKKARAARKKIASYHAAVMKLIKSLDDADAKLLDPKLPKMDAVSAKISRDEEKVLKFEREAEKQRLADEAKKRKLQEQEAKKRAKEEAAERKRREKEEAAEQKRREKEEAAQAREEVKRRKEEEKEEKEQAKKLEAAQKEKKLAKQQNTFKSFFGAPKKATAKPQASITAVATAVKKEFDAVAFRSQIGSMSNAPALKYDKLSKSAKASRKRRIKKVAVLITKVTSPEEGGWDAPAYAEQKEIMVPNKYRYLSFHEDCRPAWHGTWSKTSSIVTGKTPFGREKDVFDYDYDSEAEWEEGDDEVGEDVDDDAKNQEDEEDGTALYDYDDGFCVADEKMLDDEENADAETKALYKKKMQREMEQQKHMNRIRIIAPGQHGIPLNIIANTEDSVTDVRFEGFQKEEVATALHAYQGTTLYNINVSIDLFPETTSKKREASKSTKDTDDFSKEEMISMIHIVHHCSFNSKDKVVEQLRTAHSSVFSNRAKTTRKLDAIAAKKKHPVNAGEYFWEVKKEVLEELDLKDLLAKESPGASEAAAKTAAAANGSTKKANPAAKKRKKPTTTSAKTEETSPKKAKASTKTPPKKANSDTPAAKSSASKSPGSKGKKKKGLECDATVGMKNLMASFIKKPTNKAEK